MADFRVAAIPQDLMSDPNFEAALKLALMILEGDENAVPVKMQVRAVASVTRADGTIE